MNKSRYNSIYILSNKSTKIENPWEIDISNGNLSISVLYGHRESLLSLITDQQHIPLKNKIKKTSDTLITIRKNTQEPVNPGKRAKEDNIPDVKKSSPKERTPLFWNKVDYKGDTNEKYHGSNDSPSETEGCVRKLE